MPLHSKVPYVEVVVPKSDSKACRLCEKEDGVHSIEQCIDIISAIAQIEVAVSPEYPSGVCNQCMERLMDAYEMRDLCIESERRLTAVEEQVKVVDANFLELEELEDTKDDVTLVGEEVGIIEQYQGGQVDLIEIEDRVKIEEYMDVETLDEVEEAYIDGDETISEIEMEDRTNEFVEEEALDEEVVESKPKVTTPGKRNKVIVLRTRDLSQDMPQDEALKSRNKRVVVRTPHQKRPRSPPREGENETARKQRKAKERRQQMLDTKSERLTKHCCQCEFNDCKKNEVKRHFQETHAKIRPVEKPNTEYTCDLCWDSFETMADLLIHLKNPEVKVFLCDNCEFSALTLDLLKRHNKNVHGIEEIHKCDMCPREFSHQSSLKGHKDSVHYGVTYSCDICGRSFKNSDNLRGHKNVHEGIYPYECHVCDFRTARKSNLDAHMRSHTGSKPYKCPYCEKSFSFVTDRKRHIPVHTGVYPYTCEICDKGFIRKKLLTLHQLVHEESDVIIKTE